jgi:hypothetical protein
MTMDLVGPGGEQQFNVFAWGMLLDIALQNGWELAGAQEPEGGDEEGDESPDEAVVELDAPDCEVPPDSPLAGAIKSLMPPADDPLLGSYFYNCGFRVTAEDARALAEALERALPDVPDHDALAGKTFTHPDLPGVRLVNATTPVNPYEWFSGKKGLLQDFIAFCRQGGFEIW